MLGYVGNTFRKICFVSDFILYTVYTVGAYALTSILPSLGLINMIYGGHKNDASVNF
jgi:hypothetical protein